MTSMWVGAGQLFAALRTTAGKPLPHSRILLCGVPDVYFPICQCLTTGSDGTARVSLKPWISTTYRGRLRRDCRCEGQHQ